MATEPVCYSLASDLSDALLGFTLLRQENPCDAIYDKMGEETGILAEISGKRTDIYQKMADRQDELAVQCPQDLSIIACVAEARGAAQAEFADELAPLNAQHDAHFEYYLVLRDMHNDCIEATQAGRPYLVDIPPAPPYDAGNSPITTPGENAPTQSGADSDTEGIPIPGDGTDSDADPAVPVDNQEPPVGPIGDGEAVGSDGEQAPVDGSKGADTAGESEQRKSRFPLADRAIGRMGQAGPVLEFYGGAITGVIMTGVEWVTGTIATLDEVASGDGLKNFFDNVARAWDAGDTPSEKMLNVAGHLTTYINPFPAIVGGLNEMGEGVAEGDGMKFGHGYGTAVGTTVTTTASVGASAQVARQAIKSRGMPKSKPNDAPAKSVYETVGAELDAANKMAIEARKQNTGQATLKTSIPRIITDDGTVIEFPSAEEPSPDRPLTDMNADSMNEEEL